MDKPAAGHYFTLNLFRHAIVERVDGAAGRQRNVDLVRTVLSIDVKSACPST